MQIGFNPHLTLFFSRYWFGRTDPGFRFGRTGPGYDTSRLGDPEANEARFKASCNLHHVHPRLVIQRPMVRQCAVALANHDVQRTGFSTTTRGQRGWFKTSLGELNGTSYLKTSQQNLRVWKKQWFLKDPPVLSGGEVDAKRTVYKTKLFYPRALRNLWLKKGIPGLMDETMECPITTKFKVKGQTPASPGNPPATCLKSCVLRLAKARKSSIESVLCDLWLKGTLNMDSVNLRETLLLEKKWAKGRRRYFELQSSELGEQKQSTGTTWISIGWCRNQICPIFVLTVLQKKIKKVDCRSLFIPLTISTTKRVSIATRRRRAGLQNVIPIFQS